MKRLLSLFVESNIFPSHSQNALIFLSGKIPDFFEDRLRQIAWQENVENVIKYSHEKSVICRLKILLAASNQL